MNTPPFRIPDLEDTIVARSSAAGPGARAVVRLSGKRAVAILSSVCPDYVMPPISRFFQGNLRLPSFHGPIDADVYHFAAPRTYTGQDVVEIHLISCEPIVAELIAACLNTGARAAQAGEFTMRAFLAGKLDLTRAEAVLGVIDATNRHDLTQALSQLAGGLAQPMHALREDLLNLLADVEASLDFADEDIRFVHSDDLLLRIGKGLALVTILSRQMEKRALGQRAFRVVLAGPPNAGKSSLFNALVDNDNALVSNEPGTTRDYLQHVIDIDGVRIELVDTAGKRDAVEEIEASAQSLGQRETVEADLILWCVPYDNPTPLDRSAILPSEIQIATKADLGPAPGGMLACSAVTGTGLAELRQVLALTVRRASHAPLAPSLSRCRHHVHACMQHLRNAHAFVIDEAPGELLALELRLAMDELGAMAGAVYTDDLLERVFSRFCIGK